MKKNAKLSNNYDHKYSNSRHPITKFFLALIIIGLLANTVYGQQVRNVKGIVIDQQQNSVIGAIVAVKGSSSRTSTNAKGEFSFNVPIDAKSLIVTYVGMIAQEVNIGSDNYVKVIMKDDLTKLNEVVVVGYGTQKKASVVAAIAQTTGKVLERAGGVSSIGAALTGNVPGVVTTASTGMPGDEDPEILIRGRSTWNNTSPLILVDGIERPMTSVDIGSVESVSVLKDASATAVFGVRGANGVILITTKRGRDGQASIRGTVNNVAKVPSKLPGKYDAYDALRIRNQVIEYELALRPESWNDYLPQAVIDKYRFPANQTEAERYPNVNWDDVLFKSYATAHNANLNISGGTNKVKYFASADYLYEGDLFRKFENNRGYEPGYGFNRLNMRSNLDFQLSKSTVLRANLSGSRGVKKMPWGASNSDYSYWIAAYSTAPDVFMPRYADGTWGYHAPNVQRGLNSARLLAVSGLEYTTTNRITTDFTLDQDLGKVIKGLNFKGTIALDNTFVEGDRGVNDLYNDVQSKWVDPETGQTTYQLAFDATNRFDFQNSINWATSAGSVQNWATFRRLFYQAQLNYSKSFAKHNFTAMGLFNRNQDATGSAIPFNREDWVFRTTYNYANKYMIEYNGSYNGSSKFGPENRFAFFSSGGLGWTLSEEKFMKPLTFINNLKIRGSYGEIGDDSGGDRWLYLTQWGYGGQTDLGITGEGSETSPYVWYKENALGNPDIRWEKVQKLNVGVDFGFLKGFISGKVDFFKDKRSDILLTGNRRAIPTFFGAVAPTANLGAVENKGYEVEVAVDKKLNPDWRVWGNVNYTRAKDRVLNADDALLLPGYQKREDMQISQTYSHVSAGYYNTWDELYASTMTDNGDAQKLPGNFHILDYNADGIIDSKDNIPYAFPSVPQHTFNATMGFDWKGFSAFVQVYGVNNVTRQVVFGSLSSQNHLVYNEGSYWSKDNTNADVPLPRWLSTPSSYNPGSRFMFDGSYIRLKNAEIAYTFRRENSFVKKIGIASMRVFFNGNNLAVWTKMPDDRESNFAGTGWASQGAYPTVKRFNLGTNITF
ncbi:SusC/RagA family TonB-linked outer membrane protein [Desertivirga arenae]|uniref:SusC/RagA family TonB-linked outer membrane protein n=1 Tax=Desertivirga arenae TaxID=2810309 RepID=UPI001A9659A4|nr:TonB-dependent receptor [Pedobacter sp. SYSU D00823]